MGKIFLVLGLALVALLIYLIATGPPTPVH